MTAAPCTSYVDLQRRPTRSGRYKTIASASILPPPLIPDADWQAGLTRGNERWRPFLGGEPVVGALAAAVGEFGWVKIRHPKAEEANDADPFCDQTHLLRGVVTLVAVPRCCR
jgi:hypothetical protein